MSYLHHELEERLQYPIHRQSQREIAVNLSPTDYSPLHRQH